MSEQEQCPNQARAERTIKVFESFRDSLLVAADQLAEDAASMNKAAAEDPVATLDLPMSVHEHNDIAFAYLAGISKIDEAVNSAAEVVAAPCPGRQRCAQACLKRTVITEVINLTTELGLNRGL